ncbi:hypothetical protein GCM10010387_50730 [Streptomyces inusitatus]|uniref:Transport permease protein n=1 Tax=Streptomyces inusitatus TaxID=68221 RepID=A0A918QK50_9ACTN|nr:ABC transporter permease [Streptomyces inusitatus]GGZ50229.1 hypothetical protein GCM10010387_50730 [Streptomyces inusitatus]
MRGLGGAVIMRHELRIIGTMPGSTLLGILLPIVLAALTQGLFAAAVPTTSADGTGGAELAVPGMAVAFAALGVGRPGFAFFRDHAWGTWDRLRASPASTLDIVVGKVAPWVIMSLVQMLGLFAVAVPLLGFRVSGSWPALVLVLLATALCLSVFGALLAAVSRTSQQLNSVSGLCGLVLAALGGALVPLPALPNWVSSVAPALPTHWAVRGLHMVVLERGGLADAAVPLGALLGFTAVFAALTTLRFRSAESKIYWG